MKKSRCVLWAGGFYGPGNTIINVWTMPATMLKNKVTYRQFIHSVAFVN